MDDKEQKTTRKQMFDKMEKLLREGQKPEDNVFYHHPSEDRIVLSHALFWVLTSSIKGKIAKQKHFVLLRKYQEQMLDAYLRESEDFTELLRYCNILFEYAPIVYRNIYDIRNDKAARRVVAMFIVAGGYGGDMKENLADEILDDMDFVNNKVKCRKIEQMMPRLEEMVAKEIKEMFWC